MNKKTKELLRRYLIGKTTAEEEKKVDDWYNSVNDADDLQIFDKTKLSKAKEEIYQKLAAQVSSEKQNVIIPFYKRAAFKAAAILIACVCAVAFLLIKNNNDPQKNMFAENQVDKPGHDVKPPARNKAVLKLADGTLIQLDSTGAGTLAIQGNIQIVKMADGWITYKGNPGDEMSYNTLSVPRGSKPVKLVLADGSEVWLNVASSITYPAAFVGKERKVEITGEAYFEITKNKDMPFVVKRMKDDAQVRVLGTHFNVNAYEDENVMKITLLEGSIDILKSGSHNILKAGQQAIINNHLITVVNNADLEEVMAWKNGRFYFDGADIKTVMRQLEKWYNVEVVYQSDISSSFVAKISRDVNVLDILTVLERTDLVHFNVEGTKITVTK